MRGPDIYARLSLRPPTLPRLSPLARVSAANKAVQSSAAATGARRQAGNSSRVWGADRQAIPPHGRGGT